MLYQRLLGHAVAFCGTALLVVRDSLQLEPSARLVFQKLAKFLRSAQKRAEWPGTKLLHGTAATVYEYEYNEALAHLLQSMAHGLYEWRQPRFPEDLCLLRPDRNPWLVSISHERDGYLELQPGEYEWLRDNDREMLSILRAHQQATE